MAKNQMTPTQRNYAITRVNEILGAKERAVRKGCLRQETCSLSYAEAVKLIVKGAIKPKKQNVDCDIGYYTKLGDVFDIDAATDYYRLRPIYDEKTFEKRMAVIKERALIIKDKLMLGDASEALRMVNEFESELNGKKSSKQVA